MAPRSSRPCCTRSLPPGRRCSQAATRCRTADKSLTLNRELAAFLEQACARQPLVLLIEDIHWADVSTVDLLGYVLTRLKGSRLLAVATYRPAELQMSNHPFMALKLDMQTRGGAREV